MDGKAVIAHLSWNLTIWEQCSYHRHWFTTWSYYPDMLRHVPQKPVPRGSTRGEFLGHTASHRLPGGSEGNESVYNAGDLDSIPGLARSPGEGNGYPLQDSGLENSKDCAVHRVTKSWTGLSKFYCFFYTFIVLIELREDINKQAIKVL